MKKLLLSILIVAMHVSGAYSMKLEKEQENTGPCKQTKLLISAAAWNQLEKAKQVLGTMIKK